MRHIGTTLILGLLAFVPGCFPLELDVNDKGEVLVARQEGFFVYNPRTREAQGIMGPSGGQPVFARFAPGGKEALLIVRTGMEDFRFDMMPLQGGRPRTIFKGRDTAYALFSPTGHSLAVTRVTEKAREKDSLRKVPELILIDPAKGTHETVLDDIHVTFRWFADSQRLLLFKIQRAENDGARTFGQLIEFDVKTRQQKRLAAIITNQWMSLDLAPDNQTVLFTAFVAGKPDDKLEMPRKDFAQVQVFAWSIPDQSLRVVHDRADCARFSPSGKKVLLAKRALEGNQLFVATTVAHDAPRLLVSDAALEVGPDLILPSWLDDDTVFYLANRAVYGGGGKSLSLMTIRADGTGKKNVQPALDRAVLRLLKTIPNFAPLTEITPVEGGHSEPAPVPGPAAQGQGPDVEDRAIDMGMVDLAAVLAFGLVVLGILAVALRRKRARTESVRETSNEEGLP